MTRAGRLGVRRLDAAFHRNAAFLAGDNSSRGKSLNATPAYPVRQKRSARYRALGVFGAKSQHRGLRWITRGRRTGTRLGRSEFAARIADPARVAQTPFLGLSLLRSCSDTGLALGGYSRPVDNQAAAASVLFR
jgi:hypothetical protein